MTSIPGLRSLIQLWEKVDFGSAEARPAKSSESAHESATASEPASATASAEGGMFSREAL